MMSTYISVALRKRVTKLAGHRCGYCLRTEELMGMSMTIEHLIPQALGGSTTEDNLWLACTSCNQFKGTQIKGRDSQSRHSVKLFNPRLQVWNEHFAWSADGTQILGKTPCGRVTVIALQMNNPEIIVT
ncbi:HNH endonuclease signature motif containing protein [Candidatus Marithioploca araucensis]|uniref:HNH endonuclease signature motif containing protein n=1 Tax=Candidatus Marithioploca araucensis TaxID=70273 RepID=A0ABT7VTN7_9GAMM|nr:HNH endonuclease signature motif containing protein [Candidatus Marithioploca araucensis]